MKGITSKAGRLSLPAYFIILHYHFDFHHYCFAHYHLNFRHYHFAHCRLSSHHYRFAHCHFDFHRYCSVRRYCCFLHYYLDYHHWFYYHCYYFGCYFLLGQAIFLLLYFLKPVLFFLAVFAHHISFHF